MPYISIIVSAYILDLFIGDPQWPGHPVRVLGKFIAWFERRLYPPWGNCPAGNLRRVNEQHSSIAKRLRGAVLVVVVVGLAYAAPRALIAGGDYFAPGLGFAVSVFFVWSAISVKALKREAMRVYRALRDNDIVSARRNLSAIVGRDTGHLGPGDIIRATLEAIAESVVDGIVSPLFFAFLGGAPLCMAYRAVNTLDSMVGYKNERYKDFGWAAARLDDAANFIPARLSPLLFVLACGISGKDGWAAARIAWRDGGKNPSPNSGIPQAALAGALGAQLGGESFYRGQRVDKPRIGEDKTALSLGHIPQAIRIAYLCAGLMVLMFCVLRIA
ncbi:MAG: adenosylcobinamide-phosphate synthase CbiB [Candidatus Omnitrophota bacterium]